jgi:hypothetical protein
MADSWLKGVNVIVIIWVIFSQIVNVKCHVLNTNSGILCRATEFSVSFQQTARIFVLKVSTLKNWKIVLDMTMGQISEGR